METSSGTGGTLGGGLTTGGGSGNQLVANGSCSIMFDSQYYAYPHSTIEVKVEVEAQVFPTGQVDTFTHSYTVPVRNRACIAADPLVGLVAQTTKQWFNHRGHESVAVNWPGWQHTDLKSSINGATNIFQYYEHSSANLLCDGRGTQTNSGGTAVGEPIFIFAQMPPKDNMEDHLVPRIGQGLPPFNSGSAPVQLTSALSCNTAGPMSSYGLFMYPYYNGYGKYLENLAVIGTTICTYIDDYQDFSREMNNALWDGVPVKDVPVVLSRCAYPSQNNYDVSDFQVLGDGEYRLRRAYDPLLNRDLFWRPEIP